MVKDGLSLIEVIVALSLLGIGLLGAAGSTLLATRVLRTAETSEQGALTALQLIDSLIQEPIVASGQHEVGQFRARWDVTRDSAGLQLIEVTLAHSSGADSQTYRLMHLGVWP